MIEAYKTRQELELEAEAKRLAERREKDIPDHVFPRIVRKRDCMTRYRFRKSAR